MSDRDPVPANHVAIDDAFWAPRLRTHRRVTLPHAMRLCRETGRIANFARAAGLETGAHQGIFYDDSDVFKVLEGAAAVLGQRTDPALAAEVDEWVTLIAAAQEPDGYLYTARTIDPDSVNPDREGSTRWSNLGTSHELYNAGHLYEAAVAHYRATGKRSLLDVALKNADLIERTFGPGKRRDVPGHQEIEIGLVKLYRLTGESRHLNLARFFLEERGQAAGRTLYEGWGDPSYMQDHRPALEQREAAGHAVRAVYMYNAMTEVAALTSDGAYFEALDGLWRDVVNTKMYLTGGIGARHQGEAFGAAYELPNETAYAETCAAVANALWQQRLFLLHGHGRYLDVLERILYNGFLSGVSLDGDSFFYPNPLASDGVAPFNGNRAATRRPWFRTACCPTNVARFMPAIPGSVYAQKDDTVYLNLFVAGEAEMTVSDRAVRIRQETDYPWDGRVRIIVTPDRPATFTLHVRIPGWVRGRPAPGDLYRYLDPQPGRIELAVNGSPVDLDLVDGFARFNRTWQAGDVLEVNLPMPVRRVISHEKVTANRGRVALERGPLVYCLEGIDNGGRISHLALPDKADLTVDRRPELLGGISVICCADPPITAVPYYAWSHRGPGEMAVWLPRR